MKSQLMNLLTCSLLLTFAVACGNKNSTGSSHNPAVNPLNLGGLNASGTEAYNSLKAWYESTAAEAVSIGSNGSFVKKTSSVGGFQANINICAPLFGLNSGCVVPSACYINNNTGLYLGTPNMSNSVYTGCNVTGSVIYKKSNNLSLKEAMTGKNGLSLLRSSKSGAIYTLEYGEVGSLNPSVVYQVNTSIHSMFNPIYIKEGSQETKFLGFQIYQ